MDSKATDQYSVLHDLKDFEKAVDEIKTALISQQLSKMLFKQMLHGFRFLSRCLRRGEAAHEEVLQWCKLYLKMQRDVIIKDENIAEWFEKTRAAAISYAIACLPVKTSRSHYHFNLLTSIEAMVRKAQQSTLEALANSDKRIIASLWNPVRYIGNFTVQVLVVTLLRKLLKRSTSAKKESVVNDIRGLDQSFKSRLMRLTDISSSTDKRLYRQTVRLFLNDYNMGLAPNFRVYSFRCKLAIIGGRFEFSKAMFEEEFWVDLNDPHLHTLGFHASCKIKSQEGLISVFVYLSIYKMNIDNNILLVRFLQTPWFSKKLYEFEIMKSASFAKFELTDTEIERFKTHCVVENFNAVYKKSCRGSVRTNMDASVGLNQNKLPKITPANSFKNKNDVLGTKEQKENLVLNLQPIPKHIHTSSASATKIAQVGYQMRLPPSDETSQRESEFKLPSLTMYEEAIRKIKVQSTNQNVEKASINQPKIESLNINPFSSLKPKQVNAVKPLNFVHNRDMVKPHCVENNNVKTQIFTSNTSQHKLEDDSINHFSSLKPVHVTESNTTNILPNLDSDNENDDENNNERVKYSKHKFFKRYYEDVSTPVTQSTTDVYDDRDVSDAEPGQSYRHFKTRQLKTKKHTPYRNKNKPVQRGECDTMESSTSKAIRATTTAKKTTAKERKRKVQGNNSPHKKTRRMDRKKSSAAKQDNKEAGIPDNIVGHLENLHINAK